MGSFSSCFDDLVPLYFVAMLEDWLVEVELHGVIQKEDDQLQNLKLKNTLTNINSNLLLLLF